MLAVRGAAGWRANIYREPTARQALCFTSCNFPTFWIVPVRKPRPGKVWGGGQEASSPSLLTLKAVKPVCRWEPCIGEGGPGLFCLLFVSRWDGTILLQPAEGAQGHPAGEV